MDTGLQKYRAIVMAADTGSIVHAAEKLDYSVSSISRMIADVEADCGLRLFERSKTGVTPTQEGLRMIARARSIVAECDRFEEEAASLAGAEVGTVRVGTIASVSTHVLPPALKQLREQHPGIVCELLLGDYAEIESWLADGSVDLGTLRMPATAGYDTISLINDQHVAILPADHPAAKKKRFPLSGFSKEPFISLERGMVSEVAELFARNNVTVSPTFTAWDDYTIMAMVEAGLGLAILPSIMLQRCAYNVVALPLTVTAKRQIVMAWRNDHIPSPATQAFLETLPRVEAL